MSLKDAYDMFDRNNDNAITAQEMMDFYPAHTSYDIWLAHRDNEI